MEPPKPGGPRALWRSMRYLRAYRRETLGAFFALLFVLAANLLVPQLVRLAIDGGIAKHEAKVVALSVGGMLTAALVRGLFSFLQEYLAERASQGVAFDMREALFAQIQRLSFSYYDRMQTGQLLTRLTNDVEQIRTFTGKGVIQLVEAAVMLCGSALLLFHLNWRLALISLSIIPAILVVLTLFVKRVGPLIRQVQQLLGRLNTVLQEDLVGMRVIRAFARENRETERYRDVNDALLQQNLAIVRVMSNNFPVVMFLSSLGTLAVVWYGGMEVLNVRLTVGELIAFNSYLGFLFQPVMILGFLSAGIARAGASSLRVFEILEAPLDIHDRATAKPLPPLAGRVEFRDVTFRYPGGERDVLTHLSFKAEPGQMIAIIGTTGSGKSSIINLLPRFYDVTAGQVLIDGHDVRDLTLASLRSQFGIVLQDAMLFSGTVRDNIAYGKPDATQEEIERVAHAAQAANFIHDLPAGYETVVGERGVGLSGGQRQRLAIARALLVDPRLMILDDSTSAVDAETEAALRATVDALMRDRRRTAFVIAQRISTVRDADLILVLDQGRIAARGTHQELLRQSDLYNTILGSQILKGADLAMLEDERA